LDIKMRFIFYTPSSNIPSGGIRFIYRIVDFLNLNSIESYVHHDMRNFECNWFNNNTLKLNGFVETSDILVIPENYVLSLVGKLKGLKYIILVQNGYYICDYLPKKIFKRNTDLDSFYNNSIAVLSNSNYTTKILKNLFNNINIKQFRCPPHIFPEDSLKKKKIISYMSRKNNLIVKSVIYPLLDLMSEGWEFIDISYSFRSEKELCDILSESFIFLSFGSREGFNNPPLEAANAGCYVIGYHGYGGLDYWNDENFITINEGDIVDFQNQIRATTFKFGVINTRKFKNSHTLENSSRSIVDAFKSIINDDILCTNNIVRKKIKLQKNYFIYKSGNIYNRIKKLLYLVIGN